METESIQCCHLSCGIIKLLLFLTSYGSAVENLISLEISGVLYENPDGREDFVDFGFH